MDIFGRSSQFCYLEFDKEAISAGVKNKMPGIAVGFVSDIRELSFCGPCLLYEGDDKEYCKNCPENMKLKCVRLCVQYTK